MKQIGKVVSAVLLLLLLALSGCTPGIPSDLTAPPSTAPSEPTEHIQTELDGLGTICDIEEYGNGYLLLTHTGLYTADPNFQNCERLGSPYNDAFDECKDGTFFYRLTAVENYDLPYFENLYVSGAHIYFYCEATRSFFVDGKETKLDDFDLKYCSHPRVAVHNGAFYTLIQNNVFNSYLFKNDEPPLIITEKSYTDIIENHGKLYLLGADSFTDYRNLYLTEVLDDLSLCEPILVVEGSPEGELLKANDEPGFSLRRIVGEEGKYRYRAEESAIEGEEDAYGETEILGYTYTLSRTDGEKVETLECEGLDELINASECYFWFVKDDSQFVIITQSDRRTSIRILDFTAKEK